jgi:hypothetical protein
MSATLLKFPWERRFALRVEREASDLGWLVVTHDREYGWLSGDFNAALHDAGIIAAELGVNVNSTAAA